MIDLLRGPHNVNSQKILVTGGTGFIGRAVVARLRLGGFFLRVLVRDLRRAKEILGDDKIEFVVGDVRDPKIWGPALVGINGVVHLAGCKNDEPESEETNVRAVEYLVRVAAQAQADWIINVSTQSTKIKKKGLYAITKERAERIFAEAKIPVINLRLSLVYGVAASGASATLLRAATLPIIPVFGSGAANFRPIFVDDVAEAIFLVAQKKLERSQDYDLGGPEEFCFNELLRYFAAHVGNSSVVLIPVPTWIGLGVARVLRYLVKNPSFTESNVLGSLSSVEMEVERFYREFSFTPRSLRVLWSLPDNDEIMRAEARAILSYLFVRTTGDQQKLTDSMVALLIKAYTIHGVAQPVLINRFMRHRFFVEMADAFSGLVKRRSLFRKKMIIAAAIFECQTASARFLLPSAQSLLVVISKSILSVLRFSVAFLGGLVIGVLFPKIFVVYE